ncbi:hypothetical protein ACET3Z_020234 [Daucus carota]
MAAREQALSLLAAANNHGDLAVKLSSLKQAKDILVSIEPSLAADLFPFLAELSSSPESLVRKAAVEVIEEIGLNAREHFLILMPTLLTSVRDNDSTVATKSIITGAHILGSVLYELSLQFYRRGIVERWLEELWSWMIKFRDAVFGVLLETGPVAKKLLAVKFLETYILYFTYDTEDPGKCNLEAVLQMGRPFNVSWLFGGHPAIDVVALTSESNRYIGVMLDILRSAGAPLGSMTIAIVNCLAAIAKKRPLHCSSILSALLEFDPNFETEKGAHIPSIQYSLRTAFLGFLRCNHPAFLEFRERLLKALRAMNAGDAADQVMRQVDKMLKLNERTARDARLLKDEQATNHLPFSVDLTRKRHSNNEFQANSFDVATKRARYDVNTSAPSLVQKSDSGHSPSVNGSSPGGAPPLNSDLNPVEQMIGMIGALIAEGDRGAESLKILISNIHPEILADIVITNMKHLPKSPPPLIRLGSLSTTRQNGSSSGAFQVPQIDTSVAKTQSVHMPFSSPNTNISSLSEVPAPVNPTPESKRDPRRDPRRLDPRRSTVQNSSNSLDNNTNVTSGGFKELELEDFRPLNKPDTNPLVTSTENNSAPFVPEYETDVFGTNASTVSSADDKAPKDGAMEVEETKEAVHDVKDNFSSDDPLSPINEVNRHSVASEKSEIIIEDPYSFLDEADEPSPSVTCTPVLEEVYPELPSPPSYVELDDEQKRNIRKIAVESIIDSHKHLNGTDYTQTWMSLVARLVAQIDADEDVVVMMLKHIGSDYQHQKGHELVMHVLYYLNTLMLSDSVAHSSLASGAYEKFLLGVARSLLDTLPTTDKSFSRLLGEVPYLPDTVLKLLNDVCCSDHGLRKDARDGDRITQGLGAVWSLILGRPANRQACLDIALKCAVHSQDDIRAKAIRLVTNKLYVISYISEDIEQFATNMLLSTMDQNMSNNVLSQSGDAAQRTERELGSLETSTSGSQLSEPGTAENESAKGDSQSDVLVSFAQAQQHISLFFALCTKKPALLQVVFDNYSRAPRAVKQAIHRHIPIFVRALGSSYSELLHIISNPPQGSENLLTQVLNVLSEGTVPSADLVATVRRLYETKLKDATILIPMLPSFAKNEVLPIFPRLVDLPLDKFQTALANILQGTAQTGAALTPAEVLVAIHDINPERDGLVLKKITDACSACFEQRTVFTQQVLAKALKQMVDQTPLPMLFMRTVIQAIDAYPTLVDFVMEILLKLVDKQVWRMPKLWVGFLKCVSQTQPHSLRVLLQLPSPQLEGALKKFSSLRSPLAAYANQPSIKTSLPRATVALLGLANERNMQQPHRQPSLHSSEQSSSIHDATPT